MGDINRPRRTVVVGEEVTGNAKKPDLILPVRGISGQDVTGNIIHGDLQVQNQSFIKVDSNGVNDGIVIGARIEGNYEAGGDQIICVNTGPEEAQKMRDVLSQTYTTR